MLKVLIKKLLIFGDGVLSRIKYDFNYKYDSYEFFKARFLRNEILKKELEKQLYKKV